MWRCTSLHSREIIAYALNKKIITDGRENWSMCKKKQRIAHVMYILNHAKDRVENGTRVIVNIGLTDILNGMSGEELNDSFRKLVDLCYELELKPIIFFVNPYNITNENGIWEKMNNFNDHLAKEYKEISHPLHGWDSDKLRAILCDCLPR